MLILLLGLLFATSASANPPVKGGCMLGGSQAAHGLSVAEAEARIKRYARLYLDNYTSYKNQQRVQQKKAYSYLELDRWTQDDVIGFTREQREFMYISIGAELAAGKVHTSQLAGYAAAIDQKIFDIEVELDCDVLPGD